MVQHLKAIILALLAGICLLSCNNKFYAPNQILIPNLQKVNDLNIRGSFESGNEVVGVGFSAAYSPFNNFGVAGSYNYFSASENENPSFGRIWDVSAGFYIPSGMINYEFYAGYGSGFNHQFLGEGSWGDFNIHRFHGQGSLVVNASDYFRFFAGVRMGSLHFGDSDIILSDQTSGLENLEFIQRGSPFFLLEPTWGFYLGTPGFYFVLQRTASYSQLSKRQLSSNMSSIGISINPVYLFDKNRKKPLKTF